MKKLTTQQIQMIAAIKQGNFNEVHNLVSQGIDLNFRDENFETVFSIAAHHGKIRILNFLILDMHINLLLSPALCILIYYHLSTKAKSSSNIFLQELLTFAFPLI